MLLYHFVSPHSPSPSRLLFRLLYFPRVFLSLSFWPSLSSSLLSPRVSLPLLVFSGGIICFSIYRISARKCRAPTNELRHSLYTRRNIFRRFSLWKLRQKYLRVRSLVTSRRSFWNRSIRPTMGPRAWLLVFARLPDCMIVSMCDVDVRPISLP